MLVPVVDMKLTGQNIASLRTQRGISVRDLQHMLGFTRHSPSINGNGVKPFLPLKTWSRWRASIDAEVCAWY